MFVRCLPSSRQLSVLTALAALAALAALMVMGCSGSAVLATGDGAADAGPDAPRRTGPYDECGNGMDDDGDGLIDEGCPCAAGESQSCFSGQYPNRLVGACADGLQLCDTSSSVEFGYWGACTDDQLPNEESCNGVDDDCDGAVDEGCPCTTGETSACGADFVVAPCTGGVQTCDAAGEWSSCDGAVGPSAEVCGDDVDNDCDGVADERCDCVPLPEVCGDGVDNDCDDEIDEDGCLPPPADAGTTDAGPTDAGADTGRLDGGGPPDGGLCPGGSPSFPGIDVSRTLGSTFGRGPRLASRGTRAAFMARRDSSSSTQYFHLLDEDGNLLTTTPLPLPFDEFILAVGSPQIYATSSGYVVGMGTQRNASTAPFTSQYHVVRFDPDGAVLGTHSFPRYDATYVFGVGSIPDPGSITGPVFAAPSGRLAVLGVSPDGASAELSFFDDATLTSTGHPPLRIADSEEGRVTESAVFGSRLALSWWTQSGAHTLLVSADLMSVSRSPLAPVTRPAGGYHVLDMTLAATPTMMLACYRYFPDGHAGMIPPHTHRCHLIDGTGAAGAAFDLPGSDGFSNNYVHTIQAVSTGSQFFVRVERSYRSTSYAGPTESFYTVATDGSAALAFPGPLTGTSSPQGTIAVNASGCVINVVQQAGARLGEYTIGWRKVCPECSP